MIASSSRIHIVCQYYDKKDTDLLSFCRLCVLFINLLPYQLLFCKKWDGQTNYGLWRVFKYPLDPILGQEGDKKDTIRCAGHLENIALLLRTHCIENSMKVPHEQLELCTSYHIFDIMCFQLQYCFKCVRLIKMETQCSFSGQR